MSLLQLPPELLLRVSSQLTTPELGHLRRTCKQIENALFGSFAREFFTKKQFMIEEVSLQALVDIANHPTLSPLLSEVVFSVERFITTPGSVTRSLVLNEMQRHGHARADVLLATGKACDMLVEAFRKLSNLRTVNIRDYSAVGRTRDNARWSSYGWSYNGVISSQNHLDAIGIGLRRLWETDTTIFPLLLHALGHALSLIHI